MLVKYMGSSDTHSLLPGTDFGGRLATPLAETVTWDWDNRHVVNTDDFPNVPSEVWELVVDDPLFLDVTGLKIVPVNEAQKMWKGMRDPEEKPQAQGQAQPEQVPQDQGQEQATSDASIDEEPKARTRRA